MQCAQMQNGGGRPVLPWSNFSSSPASVNHQPWAALEAPAGVSNGRAAGGVASGPISAVKPLTSSQSMNLSPKTWSSPSVHNPFLVSHKKICLKFNIFQVNYNSCFSGRLPDQRSLSQSLLVRCPAQQWTTFDKSYTVGGILFKMSTTYYGTLAEPAGLQSSRHAWIFYLELSKIIKKNLLVVRFIHCARYRGRCCSPPRLPKNPACNRGCTQGLLFLKLCFFVDCVYCLFFFIYYMIERKHAIHSELFSV